MSKIDSTLQFLHSQIDWNTDSNDSLIIILKKDEIIVDEVFESEEGDFRGVPLNDNSPIAKLIQNISEEVCVECLEIDYMYKYPYFGLLAKSYVEILIIMYGEKASISKEMAKAFIINDLTDYSIYCQCLETEIKLTKENIDHYQYDQCIYKLKQND